MCFQISMNVLIPTEVVKIIVLTQLVAICVHVVVTTLSVKMNPTAPQVSEPYTKAIAINLCNTTVVIHEQQVSSMLSHK